MKKNKFSLKAVAILLAVCLLASYVIYQCVLLSKDDMETQFALTETVYNTIDTKCFVVRDEHFIKNNVNGAYAIVSYQNQENKFSTDYYFNAESVSYSITNINGKIIEGFLEKEIAEATMQEGAK